MPGWQAGWVATPHSSQKWTLRCNTSEPDSLFRTAQHMAGTSGGGAGSPASQAPWATWRVQMEAGPKAGCTAAEERVTQSSAPL